MPAQQRIPFADRLTPPQRAALELARTGAVYLRRERFRHGRKGRAPVPVLAFTEDETGSYGQRAVPHEQRPVRSTLQALQTRGLVEFRPSTVYPDYDRVVIP